ncbi:MAG: hypothetical protein ABSG10_01060 [Terracidiphilus sp.]|jgi:hypothetical protein
MINAGAILKRMTSRAVVACAAASLVAFFCGLWVGRTHPARHYVRFGMVVMDTASGQVCNPWPRSPQPADPFVALGAVYEDDQGNPLPAPTKEESALDRLPGCTR